MHILFSVISLFVRQSQYQEIKISHRETDPARSLPWRENKWAELHQEMKTRLPLLLHLAAVRSRTGLVLPQHPVKAKHQTSRVNLLSVSEFTFQRKAVHTKARSVISVWAAERCGRICKAPCQPSAGKISRGTGGNAATSMSLRPVSFPEAAVETVSPEYCSVRVRTCGMTQATGVNTTLMAPVSSLFSCTLSLVDSPHFSHMWDRLEYNLVIHQIEFHQSGKLVHL